MPFFDMNMFFLMAIRMAFGRMEPMAPGSSGCPYNSYNSAGVAQVMGVGVGIRDCSWWDLRPPLPGCQWQRFIIKKSPILNIVHVILVVMSKLASWEGGSNFHPARRWEPKFARRKRFAHKLLQGHNEMLLAQKIKKMTRKRTVV